MKYTRRNNIIVCISICIVILSAAITSIIVIKNKQIYCTRITVNPKYVELTLGSNYVFGPDCYVLEPSNCNQSVVISSCDGVQLDGNVLIPTREGVFTISVYAKGKDVFPFDQFILSVGTSTVPRVDLYQSTITVPYNGTMDIQNILSIYNPLDIVPSIQYSQDNIATLDLSTYSIYGTNLGTTDITISYDHYGTTVSSTLSVVVADIHNISIAQTEYIATIGELLLIQYNVQGISPSDVSIHISDPSLLSILSNTYPTIYLSPLSTGTAYLTLSTPTTSSTIKIIIRPN